MIVGTMLKVSFPFSTPKRGPSSRGLCTNMFSGGFRVNLRLLGKRGRVQGPRQNCNLVATQRGFFLRRGSHFLSHIWVLPKLGILILLHDVLSTWQWQICFGRKCSMSQVRWRVAQERAVVQTWHSPSSNHQELLNRQNPNHLCPPFSHPLSPTPHPPSRPLRRRHGPQRLRGEARASRSSTGKPRSGSCEAVILLEPRGNHPSGGVLFRSQRFPKGPKALMSV